MVREEELVARLTAPLLETTKAEVLEEDEARAKWANRETHINTMVLAILMATCKSG